MKQSEFKKRYDPDLGRFTRQHIYGEGVMDVFKNIGAKVFGQTLKKAEKLLLIKQLQRRLQKLVNILERKLVTKYFPCEQKVKRLKKCLLTNQ